MTRREAIRGILEYLRSQKVAKRKQIKRQPSKEVDVDLLDDATTIFIQRKEQGNRKRGFK